MRQTSSIFSLAATMLAGCMGAASSPEDLPPPPPNAEIIRIANEGFSNRTSPPVNVTVTKLSSGDFLGPGMYDYYACLTATERAQWQTFQDGRLIRDVGDLHDVAYIMHLREYDYGWGSGILRRVSPGTKIGLTQTRDLCP